MEYSVSPRTLIDAEPVIFDLIQRQAIDVRTTLIVITKRGDSHD